jgi:hypothetical protein
VRAARPAVQDSLSGAASVSRSAATTRVGWEEIFVDSS